MLETQVGIAQPTGKVLAEQDKNMSFDSLVKRSQVSSVVCACLASGTGTGQNLEGPWMHSYKTGANTWTKLVLLMNLPRSG